MIKQSKGRFQKAREVLEKIEEDLLAPYARKSSRAERLIQIRSEGRAFDYRTEFQRDRDRIIYSRAFRRLKNKSRSVPLGDINHSRDALSHTIEVSQLARTIGRVLRLNEDLIEAISLGHDLGLPPFGEAGAKALDFILSETFGKELKMESKEGFFGFQRNRQSLRIVDLLEKRYEHHGINLTHDTREGILKQGSWKGEEDGINRKGLNLSSGPSFEAQCVRIADQIASHMESLDDGLRSGEIEIRTIEQRPIVQELMKKIGRGYSSLKNRYMKINCLNRGLTHLLITNVIHHSSQSLKAWALEYGVDSSDRFYLVQDKIEGKEIDFSEAVRDLFHECVDFVTKKMANSSWARRFEDKAHRMILELFRAFYSNPLMMDDYLLLRYKEWNKRPFLRDVAKKEIEKEIGKHYQGKSSFVRLICDHIAGMTDSFAIEEFQKLHQPE